MATSISAGDSPSPSSPLPSPVELARKLKLENAAFLEKLGLAMKPLAETIYQRVARLTIVDYVRQYDWENDTTALKSAWPWRKNDKPISEPVELVYKMDLLEDVLALLRDILKQPALSEGDARLFIPDIQHHLHRYLGPLFKPDESGFELKLSDYQLYIKLSM
jgi:hypothetical protein